MELSKPDAWLQMVAFLANGAVQLVVAEVAPRGARLNPHLKIDERVRSEVLRRYQAHMVERENDGYQKAERGFVEGLMDSHKVSRTWIAGVLHRAKCPKK